MNLETTDAEVVPEETDLLEAGEATSGDQATSVTETGPVGETLFHSEPWRQVVETTFDVSFETFVPESEPLGRAYYSVLSDIRGERVVCTPFSDFCDPMLGPDGWDEFAEHLRSFGRPITVRPFRHAPAIADGGFERRTELLWHGIDLTDGHDAVWDGLKTKVRTNIRRAIKGGELTFRISSDPADVETFHAMHVDLRKSKYGLLAQPLSFFMNLHDAFGDDMAVIVAEQDGEAIAAMVYFAWNGIWYYKFSASYPRKHRPNGALIMEACRHGAERGLELLDMGRSDMDQPGLVDFKQQFASIERELTTLHWQPEGYENHLGAAVGGELGRVTALLTDPEVPNHIAAKGGDLLYRYFG